MKAMTKKLGAVVLAMALCLSLCCTALAADGDIGSITIDGSAGEKYTIYQIFDLIYDEDKTSYSYKVVNDTWKVWLSAYPTEDEPLFAFTDAGYLNPDSGIFSAKEGDATMVAFAKAALAFAEESEITGSTQTADQSGEAKFEGLALGWYLVDSTQGTLCMLTSTDPDAEVEEKNPEPTVEKEQYDPTTDSEWNDDDTVNVGDTVNYEVFLKDIANSSSLCMHDVLTSGLTFTTGSVKVFYGVPDSDVTNLFDDTTTTWTEIGSDNNTYNGDAIWTETDSCGDGCTFELSFNDDWLASLASGTVIKVTYDATVNTGAVSTDDFYDVETNSVHLTYGTAQHSTTVVTESDTVGFELKKITYNESEDATMLDGAEFTLYYDEAQTSAVRFIVNGSVYEADTDSSVTGTTTTITAGDVKIVGLAEGTYYLVETKAPDGYNLLDGVVKITISLTENADGEYTETVTVEGTNTNVSHTNGSVEVDVINNAGTELPGTGGMGTTIFYIIGGVLVVGAVVVLVTRRRMTRED